MDRSKLGKSCHNHKPEYVVTPVVKDEAASVQRKFLVHTSTLVFKAKQLHTLTIDRDRQITNPPVFSRDLHDSLHESFDHDDDAEDGWTESSFGSSSSPMAAGNRKNGNNRAASSTAVLGGFPEIVEESTFYHRFTSTQVGTSISSYRIF